MGLNLPKIYLDTCIVIYLTEDHPDFGATTRSAISGGKGKRFCISPLIELECLVLPLRQGNRALIERYESFFWRYESLDLSPTVYRIAAELRARYRLKTPDALHLAAAKFHGCREIWTNDDRLKGTDGVFAVNILAGIR
jgi:predicted nucleic acid-binding protein